MGAISTRSIFIFYKGKYNDIKVFVSTFCWNHLLEYAQQYNKRDNEYWTSDIFEQRRKMPRLCVDSREFEEVPLMQDNVDSMSVSEIKEKLKQL